MENGNENRPRVAASRFSFSAGVGRVVHARVVPYRIAFFTSPIARVI
jgi:hypothetical protein